jgi:hypothetical protein
VLAAVAALLFATFLQARRLAAPRHEGGRVEAA